MVSKRKSVCIGEKVSLIRAIEKGDKKSDVAKRFGFSPSTVSTIWKNKEKFLQAEIDRNSSKKLKKPKFEDLDQVMLTWVRKQRQNKMPVSGPILKAKAEKFAKQLSITDFKASEGWLGKFKQRHCIHYGKVNGEARGVDANVTHVTDEEILDSVKKNEEKKGDEEDEIGGEPPPSIEQAVRAAKVLELFFLFNEDKPTISQCMNKMQRMIKLKYWDRKKRQTKVTDNNLVI